MQKTTNREMCYRCHKALVTCICGLIQPVANKTGILILQHAKERFHSIGTVRFARLGLQNVDIQVRWSNELKHLNKPLDPPPNTGMLYPSPTALDLADPENRPEHLIILDGTWRQARNIYHKTPGLSELPHYALHPKQPSRYTIRREPAFHCLSTIESIVAALDLLEPETEGLHGLIDAFDGMIRQQITYLSERGLESRYDKAPKNKLSEQAVK